MDLIESWAPLVFTWLSFHEVTIFAKVCAEWHRVALANIQQWAADIMSRTALSPRGTHPVLKFRPYLYELYELYRRRYIDAEAYNRAKDKLGFTDTYLLNGFGELFITSDNKGKQPRRYKEYADTAPQYEYGVYEDILGMVRFETEAKEELDYTDYCGNHMIRSLLVASPAMRQRLFFHLVAEGVFLNLNELLVNRISLDFITVALEFDYRVAPIFDPNLGTSYYPKPDAFKGDYGKQLLQLYKTSQLTRLGDWFGKLLHSRRIVEAQPLLVQLVKQKTWLIKFCHDYSSHSLNLESLLEIVEAIPARPEWLRTFSHVGSLQLLRLLLERGGLLTQEYWDRFFAWASKTSHGDGRFYNDVINLLLEHSKFFDILRAYYLSKIASPEVLVRKAMVAAYLPPGVNMIFCTSQAIHLCSITCTPATFINNLRPLLSEENIDEASDKILRAVLSSTRYTKLIQQPMDQRIDYLAREYRIIQ